MTDNEMESGPTRRQRRLLSLVLFVTVIGLFRLDWLVDPVAFVCKAVLPDGLRVTYYDGAVFEHPVARRIEWHVLRDYGVGRPALRVPKSAFSARWEGFLSAPKDAEYGFYLQSVGGARLWIDDRLIIDHWSDHGWVPGCYGMARLRQGRHRILIEHIKRAGSASIRLRWAGGGIPANTVLGRPYLSKH